MKSDKITLAIQCVKVISKETFAEWASRLPRLSKDEIRSAKIAHTEIGQDDLKNSTAHQLLAYGLDKWRGSYEFLRTADRNGTPLSEKDKSGLWMSAPRDFRDFQKLFTDPHARVIPLPRYSDRAFIRGCIISPRLVPDELAEKLGLIKLEDYRKTETGKVNRKAILEYYTQPEFTDALKIIFTSAVRLRPDNPRVKVIEPPDAALLREYTPDYKMPETLPGSIIYISQRSSASAALARDAFGGRIKHKEMSKVQVFDDAYAAARKNEHIDAGYTKEVEELSELKAELEIYRARLDIGWRKGISQIEKKDFLDEWVKLSLKVHERLEGKVDEQKLDAFLALDIEGSFKDKRGRDNVSAVMTKITKAADRLAKRLTHTRYIGGYNKNDEALLFSEIKAQETALLSFSKTVQRRTPLQLENIALFNPDVSMTPQEAAINHAGFMKSLFVSTDELKNISMRPFRQMAKELRAAYEQLSESALGRNKEKTAHWLQEIAGVGIYLENLISTEREKIMQVKLSQHNPAPITPPPPVPSAGSVVS